MSDYNLVTTQAVPQLPAIPGPLLEDAETLRKASVEVEEDLDGVLSRWHRLSDAYETSHTDQVLAQADPLKKYVLDLVSTFENAADALVGFAHALSEADIKRTSLREDIKQLYRDLNATPVPFSQRPDLRRRNVALWQQTYSLQRMLDNAVETAQERLGRIQDPPILPLADRSVSSGASTSPSMQHALLGYLSAPLFAMLRNFMDVPLPPDLALALSRVSMTTGPVDEETAALEQAWLLWGITNGGTLHQDQDGICGTRMVCVVGDLPTGEAGNVMVLGRVVLFDTENPSHKLRLHEYAHVVDQVDAGSRRFLEDYAHEAAFATAIGEDSHDGNIFEQSAELRANSAFSFAKAGEDPHQAFAVTHYDSGYQPVEGRLEDWLRWDAGARGNLTNTWRMSPIRRNMGIGKDTTWEK